MKRYRNTHNLGMSLVEVLVSMVVLTLVGASIVAALIQNRYLVERNIYTNTAFNVARGYMEQMYGMQFDDLQAAADAYDTNQTLLSNSIGDTVDTSLISDPAILAIINAIEIDTKGVDSSATSSGSVTIDRPLYVGMWHQQTILIDIKDPLGQEGSPVEITSQMRFRPIITNLDDGSNNDVNAIEVALEFQFQTRERMGDTWRTGRTLRMIRADVPVF